MTRDEALKLDAGPELDAVVGKAVGITPLKIHRVWKDGGGNRSSTSQRDCPHDFPSVEMLRDYLERNQRQGLMQGYVIIEEDEWPEFSTDIAAAWQVVEKMHADGWTIDVRVCSIDAGGGCRCTIICNYGPCERHGHTEHTFHGASNVRGDTAPLAICRAALKAVMKD